MEAANRSQRQRQFRTIAHQQRGPELPKGAAGKSGTVQIAIVIDEHGIPQDARVVGSLGAGFDEKALEAVQKWRFKPAMKAGVPVKAQATVEVNFRALPKP